MNQDSSAIWVMLAILMVLLALIAFLGVKYRPRVYLGEGLVLLFVSLVPAALAAPYLREFAQPDPVLHGFALLILTLISILCAGFCAGVGT